MIIKKTKNYFNTLKLSLSDPKYYLKILKAPLFFSIKFFLFSFLLLGLLKSLQFYLIDIPRLMETATQTTAEVEKNFPQPVSITWNQEKLILTNTEKLVVNFPEFIPKQEGLPEKLAILVNHDLTAGELKNEEYKNTFFVIDPVNLFLIAEPESQSLPLSTIIGLNNFELSKDIISNNKTAWLTQFKLALIKFAKISPLIFIPYLAGSSLWLIIWDLILVLLLVKINKLPLTFKKIFQISLHIAVALQLITQLSFLIYPGHNYPIFSVGYWVIIIYLYVVNKKNLIDLSSVNKVKK